MGRNGLRNRRTQRTPVGLDVGARLVKAIQFEPYSTGLRVAAAVLVPRAQKATAYPVSAPASAPSAPAGRERRREADAGRPVATPAPDAAAPLDAEEIRNLSDVLFRAGFEGNRVVLAAPPAGVLQSVLDLPPRSSQAPLEQIARVELGRAHKCAPDSFEMGCWDLPPVSAGHSARAGKGTLVMAVGYPHAGADALLDAFESCGLLVTALDVAPCALARACAPAVPLVGPEGGMTAVLDVGWSAAHLTLLHCGAVIYGRVIPDGGLGTVHGALTRRLGLEADVAEYLLTEVGLSSRLPDGPPGSDGVVDLPDDARGMLAAHVDGIVRELLASFSYAVRQYPEAAVSRLLLVGGGAAVPELGEYLCSVIGVDARPVSPADVAAYDAGLAGLCASPLMTLATGLAQFPEGT